MPSRAVIPSQISNEDSEHLDPEDFKAISSEEIRESRKLTSFGLNLKSTRFYSFGGTMVLEGLFFEHVVKWKFWQAEGFRML